MKENFQERQNVYKPLEDIFSINNVQYDTKFTKKLKKFLKFSIFGSIFSLFSSFALLSFVDDLSLYINIDYIMIGFLLSIPLLVISSLILFSIKEKEGFNKLPRNQRFHTPLTPAITYAIISGIFLSLPTLLTPTHSGGCFGTTNSEHMVDSQKITEL